MLKDGQGNEVFSRSVEFDEQKKGWIELKGRKSHKHSATKGMNGVERPDKGATRDIGKMGENRGSHKIWQ